jgi:hypothetical protein
MEARMKVRTVKRVMWGLFALFLVTFDCTMARAGNGVAGITYKVYRNLTSVGISAVVSGDDDSSAVLRIEQRYDTFGAYDSGMVMIRRPGFNVHIGRILWMTQGRTANFRIVATDVGGGMATPWDTVSCAEVRKRPTPGVSVYYVNQATGNNANSGLTAALAKRTFITNAGIDGGSPGALTLLLLQTNQTGAGIIVAPGEYHEKLPITSSVDGPFRFIAGDGTNRDSTIICGANEMGELGKADGSTSFTWTQIGLASLYPPTVGVYKAYCPYADSIASVTFGWGEFLHLKTSLAALFADSSGTAGNANQSAGLIGHGWWVKGDTLYVKRIGGITPAGAVLHAGYRGPLLEVGRRNWRISGLTFRYAGGPRSCNGVAGGTDQCVEDPPNSSYEGIVFGRNANSSGGVVDSCRFYGNQGPGVYARYTSAGLVADSCTIANSIFDGLTIGTMGYGASKSRMEENSGGPVSVGQMSNIYNNTINEVANGIQLGPVAGGAVDSTWGSWAETAYNRNYQLADDGIETDTGAGIGELVLGNISDSGNSGISVAPLYIGPMLVLYNTFTRFVSAGIKIGFDGDGPAHFYQNTMVSNEPGSRGFEGGSGGSYKSVAANNIFWGEVGIHGVGTDSDTANISATFNYNCIDSTSGRLIDRWFLNSTPINRSVWRAYGNEANGQVGDPGLVNLTRGRSMANLPNVRPRHLTNFVPNSLVIQKGRTLPGINSGLGGKRYAGPKPNIGAQGCYNCYYPEP